MKKNYIRPFAEDMRFGSFELCMEKDSFYDGGGGSGGGAVAKERNDYVEEDMEEQEFLYSMSEAENSSGPLW